MDDIIKSDHVETEKEIKNLPIILTKIIFILVLVIIAQCVAIVTMLPLKEKVPYIVEFKTSMENYVIVRKANKEVLSEKALIHKEIEDYVKARETINQMDEIRRYTKIIRLKSSTEVYERFLNTYQANKHLWTITGFKRACDIITTSDIIYNVKENEFISIIEYKLTDKYNDGTSAKPKFYKTTIRYEFIDQKISKADLTLNPIGTHIIDYSISILNTGDES